MVRAQQDTRTTTLVLSPNVSMSWKFNLGLILAVGVWMGLVGTGFWMIGAWPVLPFVGLEIVCLALALWITHKKLNCREVLYISDLQVCYEKGGLFPRQRVEWQRHSVRGQVLRIGHPLQSPEIALFDTSGRYHRIGSFLNKADCDLLVGLLRNQGIHLRTDTDIVQIPF